MEVFKGFNVQQQSDPPPCGTNENSLFKSIINTLVADAWVDGVDVAGHKHTKAYNGYGEKILDADNQSGIVLLGVNGGGWDQVIVEIGSFHNKGFVIRQSSHGDLEVINADDHVWDVNVSEDKTCRHYLRDGYAAATSFLQGTDAFLSFDTSDDKVKIGRVSTDARPVGVDVLGLFTAENAIINGAVNIKGGVGASPEQGEILFNAYHDGTDYRRILGGSATRLYSSGGTTYFFRCAGDAADAIITWGQPVLTIADTSVGIGTGSPGVSLSNWGHVYHYGLPSGATQVAAGAGTGELWVTSGHASLPDGVVMQGA